MRQLLQNSLPGAPPVRPRARRRHEPRPTEGPHRHPEAVESGTFAGNEDKRQNQRLASVHNRCRNKPPVREPASEPGLQDGLPRRHGIDQCVPSRTLEGPKWSSPRKKDTEADEGIRRHQTPPRSHLEAAADERCQLTTLAQEREKDAKAVGRGQGEEHVTVPGRPGPPQAVRQDGRHGSQQACRAEYLRVGWQAGW